MLTAALILMSVTSPLQDLPVWKPDMVAKNDWLISAPETKAAVYRLDGGQHIVLANGLVSRTFFINDNLATISIKNLVTNQEFVRATRPEATVTIDGTEYPIGGLTGQPDHAFIKTEWLDKMTTWENSYEYHGFKVGVPDERFGWNQKQRRHEDQAWPPQGARLTLIFTHREVELPEIHIIYDIYQGVPFFAKSMHIINTTDSPKKVDRFTLETLAFAEPESQVDGDTEWLKPNLTIVTDYSFGGMATQYANKSVVYKPDPDYLTQVNYARTMPAIMDVRPPYGPAVTLAPEDTLDSFTMFTVVNDDRDRERNGLAVRQLYRTLAPWTTESPTMLHLTSTNPDTVKTAIDQAAECGYEMVILSFGSGLNMEDASDANIAKYKAFADYAHSKGVEFGGYSLLASRRISEEHDVINPKTGKTGGTRFGNSPCLGSEWGINYFKSIKKFLDETGFDLLEHDGSYPGDVCASTKHPGHDGENDSQWKQYYQIANFYNWCRDEGIYLNVPDAYFMQGSNKTGMGYRETNWSLPRELQHVHARQNLYDGTWEKPPTMGWMFVPLVQYHGGGAEATIEPLKDHLKDYKQHLINNLGYGAQACYRGPRLYDAPETKAMVIEQVNWFKKYRDILESDIVHVRRPDGRQLDAILHVNPNLPIKGMLMVYNPTSKPLMDEIEIPLYYTGLTETATVSVQNGPGQTMTLSRDYKIKVTATVAPNSYTYFMIR